MCSIARSSSGALPSISVLERKSGLVTPSVMRRQEHHAGGVDVDVHRPHAGAEAADVRLELAHRPAVERDSRELVSERDLEEALQRPRQHQPPLRGHERLGVAVHGVTADVAIAGQDDLVVELLPPPHADARRGQGGGGADGGDRRGRGREIRRDAVQGEDRHERGRREDEQGAGDGVCRLEPLVGHGQGGVELGGGHGYPYSSFAAVGT